MGTVLGWVKLSRTAWFDLIQRGREMQQNKYDLEIVISMKSYFFMHYPHLAFIDKLWELMFAYERIIVG